VDAGLHHVQGKAERVTPLLALLQEFHRDKLEEMLRHQAGARGIRQYDANNMYQYTINREQVQVSWLAAAIAELGGTPDSGPDEPVDPSRRGPGRAEAIGRSIFEEDSRAAAAFVERWRPRVEAMTHARHRGMLRVILGETLEQKRAFDQALAGRTDLLGRREAEVGPATGDVLPTRWLE
jgi:hypothetical protein